MSPIQGIVKRTLTIILGAALLIGCSSTGRRRAVVSSSTRSHSSREQVASDQPDASQYAHATSDIVTTSHTESAPDDDLETYESDDPFRGLPELPLSGLIEQVQSRNPSLQAVQAAWAAAAHKYPQVTALEDPIFQSMYAPVSWGGGSNVQSSYYVGVAQKLPWHGKRCLRGEQAQWDATAASFDIEETRLKLGEAARIAYFDWYMNRRLRELNAANRDALREFAEIARAKYEANQVSQQDVLQADVELAQLEQRQIELQQERAIAKARINTLLHRRPDHWIPPPPQMLHAEQGLAPASVFQELALRQRPELQAIAARLQTERAAIDLACKEYYPDFDVMARYDRFWVDREQQPQFGVNMNVPLNQSRRHAAVQEARWRLQRMNAEYSQATNNIRNEIQVAYARVEGSRKSLQLLDTKILPTAEENLAAARSGYTAGTVDFLRLIAAQRQLIELREKQQEAITEHHRRLAELERAVGSPLPTTFTVPAADE